MFKTVLRAALLLATLSLAACADPQADDDVESAEDVTEAFGYDHNGPTLEVEGPALGIAAVTDLTKTNAYLAPHGLEAISPDGNLALLGIVVESHRDLFTLGKYHECYAFIMAKEIGGAEPVIFFDKMIASSWKARAFWRAKWDFNYAAGEASLTMAPGAAGVVSATRNGATYFKATMGQRPFETLTPDNAFSGDFGFVSSTDSSSTVYHYSVSAVGYTTPFDPSKGDSLTFGPELSGLLDTLGYLAPIAWHQSYDLYAAID